MVLRSERSSHRSNGSGLAKPIGVGHLGALEHARELHQVREYQVVLPVPGRQAARAAVAAAGTPCIRPARGYLKERPPSPSPSLRFSAPASGVWNLPGMYQRNIRPIGLRWQMHTGGHPHFKPAGLWSRALRVRDMPGSYGGAVLGTSVGLTRRRGAPAQFVRDDGPVTAQASTWIVTARA